LVGHATRTKEGSTASTRKGDKGADSVVAEDLKPRSFYNHGL